MHEQSVAKCFDIVNTIQLTEHSKALALVCVKNCFVMFLSGSVSLHDVAFFPCIFSFSLFFELGLLSLLSLNLVWLYSVLSAQTYSKPRWEDTINTWTRQSKQRQCSARLSLQAYRFIHVFLGSKQSILTHRMIQSGRIYFTYLLQPWLTACCLRVWRSCSRQCFLCVLTLLISSGRFLLWLRGSAKALNLLWSLVCVFMLCYPNYVSSPRVTFPEKSVNLAVLPKQNSPGQKFPSPHQGHQCPSYFRI